MLRERQGLSLPPWWTYGVVPDCAVKPEEAKDRPELPVSRSVEAELLSIDCIANASLI